MEKLNQFSLREGGRAFLLCLLFLFTVGINRTEAQSLYRSYGDPGINEGGACLVPDPANSNLYLAAYRGDGTVLIYMDANGQPIWERYFNFSPAGLNDQLYDLRFDSDGMMIGCGRSIAPGSQAFRGFAFRYDVANDNILWLNQSSNLCFYTTILEPDPGRDYVAIGYFRAGTGAGATPQALRTELDRNTGAFAASGVNESYHLASAEDFASGIALNGEVFGTGRFSNNAGVGTFRPVISELITGTAGVVNQSQYIVPPVAPNARLYPKDILEEQGNFYVTTHGDLTGGSSTVTTVQLFSASTNNATTPAFLQQWATDYEFTAFTNEVSWELLQTGNELICMGTERAGNGDIFLLNTDLNGNVNWVNRYGVPADDDDVAYNSQHQLILHNGFLYFTGESNGVSGAGDRDITLYKVNLDGSMAAGCPVDTLNVTVMSPTNVTNNVATTVTGGAALNTLSNQSVLITLPDTLICGSTCFAASDPAYSTPATLVAANSYTVWNGKIYIPANTLIDVQSGATLDMSNVDVVFGPCSGIIFRDGANLRANNSVFRPCDPSESWLGFNFEGAAAGQINECTFKNAERALAFESSSGQAAQVDVAVTNNLFSNNWWAIRSQEVILSQDISGNTFRVDANPVNFQLGCELGTYTGLHFGINLANTLHEGKITQNDFTYASRDQARFFTGVFFFASEGTISQNHFSNMWTAVETGQSRLVSIENNNIEITQEYFHNENQLRVSNSEWVYITGNRLTNSNENTQFNLTSGAIYAEGVQICNIKENLVEGFTNGIQLLDAQLVNVSENTVQNANLVGIYLLDAVECEIACNQIHMRTSLTVNTVGIEVISNIQNPVSNIRNNCISDSWDAMLLFTNVTNAIVPKINSNYMYNYWNAGIDAIGFQGSIGTTGAAYATSGRNSFFSNNVPNGVPDISTTLPLNEGGNFNINILAGPVTSGAPNTFSSLAYCALEPGTNGSVVQNDEVCDRLLNQMTGVFSAVREDRIKWQEYFGGFPGVYRPAIAGGWLGRLRREEPLAAEKLMAFIKGSDLFEDFTQQKLEFRYLLSGHELQAASELLDNMQPIHSDDRAWKEMQALQLNRRLAGMPWNKLNSSEREKLELIQGQSGLDAKVASDLLNLAESGHFYPYKVIAEPQSEKQLTKTMVSQDFMTVSPNPVSGQLSVNYFLADANQAQLELFDMQGRLLRSARMQANGGEAILDLSELPAGIYILTASNQQGRQFNQKVVKQ